MTVAMELMEEVVMEMVEVTCSSTKVVVMEMWVVEPCSSTEEVAMVMEVVVICNSKAVVPWRWRRR